MTKITIIGGGSYTWGPTFLRDIFATPELRGATIVLHDILRAFDPPTAAGVRPANAP